MLERYDSLPPRDKANYLMMSMLSLGHIGSLLQKFPRNDGNARAISAVTIFSGQNGYNIKIPAYVSDNNQARVGIVLDPRPHKLETPQADMYCNGSNGKIEPEVRKKDFSEWKGPAGMVPLETIFENKWGYAREGGRVFCTNIARHEYTGDNQSTYHKKGWGWLVAKNIWRHYFKPKEKYPNSKYAGVLKFNEALCFQAGDEKPIAGLVITHLTAIGGDIAETLLRYLRDHSHLQLYFYNTTADEHIARVMSNQQAIKYLEKCAKKTTKTKEAFAASFAEGFKTAQPYLGFPSTEEEIEARKGSRNAAEEEKDDAPSAAAQPVAPQVKKETEEEKIQNKINDNYFNGRKVCTVSLENDRFKLTFTTAAYAFHVKDNLGMELKIYELDDLSFYIKKDDWKNTEKWITPAPCISPEQTQGIVASNVPHHDRAAVANAPIIPKPEFFQEPTQAVLALNYFFSGHCLDTNTHNRQNRFYFKTREQAHLVRNRLIEEFKWQGFDKSKVQSTNQFKGSFYFTLRDDQWKQVCQEVIIDFYRKKDAVDTLLKQNNLAYTDHVRSYFNSRIQPLEQKIRKGEVSIAEAQAFQAAMQNIPMPRILKAAIGVLVISIFACALMVTGGVAVVPTVAVGIAAGFSGAYTAYGLFRHSNDQAVINNAMKTTQLNERPPRPRQAAA